jgi:hypothetical protein
MEKRLATNNHVKAISAKEIVAYFSQDYLMKENQSTHTFSELHQ